MSKHDSREITPPATTAAITSAAHVLLSAADRLGPRLTEHGPGCPAHAGGPCTCGVDDFAAAMHGLGDALRAGLTPSDG